MFHKLRSRPAIIVGCVLLIVVIAATLFLFSPLGGTPSPPDPSPPEPVPMDTPSPTPTAFFETTRATTSDSETLGELDVEYPMRVSPGSSDTVILSIYVPASLASLKPMSVERVQLPDDVPAIIGDLNSYRTTILVAETMRAELSSPGFEVESLHPAQQQVNIHEVNQPTSWAWTIRAPSSLGRQVFTLRIYLNQEISPAWVGSFHVEVVESSPTRAPTHTIAPTSTLAPTPLTPLSRAVNELIDNSATVLGAVLSFIAAMFGIYVRRSKTEDKAG